MTTFDDKEKAAENKYAHDKETQFKVHARALRLLGVWAAEKMGLTCAAAEDYAQSVVVADMNPNGHIQAFEKVRNDLLAWDVHISDHDIREQMHRLEAAAREPVAGNRPVL